MAREPYKKPIQVDNNTTKFIMACNELPALKDFSGGIERRFLIVSFDATFKGENMDTDLEEKLVAELPGIFNRVVEGYERLITQGRFTKLASSDEQVREYMNSHNSSYKFWEEAVETCKDNWISSLDLYRAYVDWCKPLSIKPVTETKFGMEIRKITGKTTTVKRIGSKIVKVREDIRIINDMQGDI